MIVEAALVARDVEQIEAAVRAAEAVDGVAPLGEQPLRALHSPGGTDAASNGVRHLVARAGDAPDSEVIGYAQLSGGTGTDPGTGTDSGSDTDSGTATATAATAELVVHPDHRRRGIGAALLRGVLEREPAAAVWAHGALPAAVALAESLGLQRTRELLKMRRRAADGPALTGSPARAGSRSVEGIELGTLADAASEGGDRWPGLDARAEFLRVNNAAFHWHPEQGGWSASQLDERLAVDWVDTGAVFLAVDVAGGADAVGGPRLAGFHWTKTVAEPGQPVEGEVYVVAVDPADQGRGLGGVLTSVGVAHLEGPVGAESVVLYVEGDNHPAVRTYEKLGFAVELVDVTYNSA